MTRRTLRFPDDCAALLGACEEGVICYNRTYKCKPDWVGNGCCYTCNNTCISPGYCEKRISVVGRHQYQSAVCVCPPRYTHIKGRGCVSDCDFDSTLDFCPEDNTALYIGLGLTAGLCVLLLLAFSILVYFLWRRRILWAQKLVYVFLPYQDDVDKADAYVSCCENGSGSRFVTNRLLPKLEDELNYKLLVQHRNFELGRHQLTGDSRGGKALQDNMIEAIESSSRVILVLTRDYVTSEWKLLELHAAFHQMIKMKNRIIPILLEDVRDDPNLQPGLKDLLSSVNCLRAPVNSSNMSSSSWKRFWTRLYYSMPKRRSKPHAESALVSSLCRRYASSNHDGSDSEETDSHQQDAQTDEVARAPNSPVQSRVNNEPIRDSEFDDLQKIPDSIHSSPPSASVVQEQ